MAGCRQARSIATSAVWRSCIFSEYGSGLCIGVRGGVYTDVIDGGVKVRRTCPCGSYCPDRATERYPCPVGDNFDIMTQLHRDIIII